MSFLVPHRFKSFGLIAAPIGFASWLMMQFGIWTKLFVMLFGDNPNFNPQYHISNVIIAIISFFSFLAGLYCIAFAKEKIEDEMIQKLRLESFQFAAAIQILSIVVGFFTMIFYAPEETGLMLFFILAIALFWVSFILRFNFVLHVKLKHDQFS
jgi:uncharacterized membrane protein